MTREDHWFARMFMRLFICTDEDHASALLALVALRAPKKFKEMREGAGPEAQPTYERALVLAGLKECECKGCREKRAEAEAEQEEYAPGPKPWLN